MKTLVLIPALGCTDGLYRPFADLLGAGLAVRVIVPTADRYPAMVEQVLQQAPDRFLVLGTSMGGRLAIEMTLAAAERVSGLVVIGAGAGAVANPAAGLERSARLRGGAFEEVLGEMGDMISHLPGPRGAAAREAFKAMARVTGAEVMARQSDALAYREDRWPRVAGIACPVLCLWGQHDRFSPTAEGQRFASAVRNGRYVEIADCGHLPTLEYPEGSAAAVKDWLGGGELSG